MSKGRIVDFTEVRNQKLEEKRRKTERIFFRQLLGIYTVTGSDEIRAIELVDVSEDGCSFQVPFDPVKPWPEKAENVPIRIYFSHDTYLPLFVKVKNSRPCIEEGLRYVRFGCEIDKSVQSFEAYRQFVRFLKSYSEHAHKDTGDVTLFYL